MSLFDLFKKTAVKDLEPAAEETAPKVVKSATGEDVILGETSYDWRNPFGIGTMGLITNEDELVGKRGLEVYRQMEDRDAQVKFCLSLKKLATLSSPWEIHPADLGDEEEGAKKKTPGGKPPETEGAPPIPKGQGKPKPAVEPTEQEEEPTEKAKPFAEEPEIDDLEEDTGDDDAEPTHVDADREEAERQARFIREAFERMEGDLTEDLGMILNAFRDGFSITEKNFQLIEDGEFQGLIGLKNLKTRRPDYWKFASDIHGNLTGLFQTISYEPLGDPWPKEKFILYSHNRGGKDASDFFGRSDLRAAWRYYASSDFVHRYMGVYMEKYAMPTAVGKPSTATARSADRAQLLTILKRMQADTAIVLPPGWEAELMEAKRSGTVDYTAVLDWNNKMIQRAVLLGGDTASSGASPGAQAGSYAMSQTHMQLLIQSIAWVQRILEEAVIGEQLIRQLIDLNFPQGRRFYPVFKFKTPIQGDRKLMADMVIALVDKGLVNKGEPWVREFLDLPAAPKVVADRLAQEMRNPPKPPPAFGFPPKDGGGPPTPGTTHGAPNGGMPAEPGGPPTEREKMSERMRRAAFAAALKRVDFAEIKKRLDADEEQAVEDLKKIIRKMAERYIKDAQARKIIEEKAAKRISDMDLSYKGEMKDTVKEWLITLFEAGGRDAKKELLKVKVTKPAVTADVKPTIEGAKLEALMKEKAFRVTGVLTDDILKKANQALVTGLEKGFTNARVMNDLAGIFRDFEGDPGIVDPEGNLLTPNRLETIVRTNFTSAYNLGRRDLFFDEDLKGFVKGVEFSAILDSRTTDICEELNGKVFDGTDVEGIERFTPPLHYNCRSILIPITEYDAKQEPFTPLDAEGKAQAEALVQVGFVEERKANCCSIHPAAG